MEPLTVQEIYLIQNRSYMLLDEIIELLNFRHGRVRKLFLAKLCDDFSEGEISFSLVQYEVEEGIYKSNEDIIRADYGSDYNFEEALSQEEYDKLCDKEFRRTCFEGYKSDVSINTKSFIDWYYSYWKEVDSNTAKNTERNLLQRIATYKQIVKLLLKFIAGDIAGLTGGKHPDFDSLSKLAVQLATDKRGLSEKNLERYFYEQE